jgi:hypothetical protein
MSLNLTASLNQARNDTGRMAYCGPMVISAITGFSVSRIEDAIHAFRHDSEAARKMIIGTSAADVAAALELFDYGMNKIEDYNGLEKKERPNVGTWMRKSRSAFSFYVLAISIAKEGHWICIKGAKLCDTYTEGKWVFAADGPHKGARIMEVWRVAKMLSPSKGLS